MNELFFLFISDTTSAALEPPLEKREHAWIDISAHSTKSVVEFMSSKLNWLQKSFWVKEIEKLCTVAPLGEFRKQTF